MSTLHTVKEAAAQMRVSPATFYALCAAKKLRHQRVGVGRGRPRQRASEPSPAASESVTTCV